MVFMRGGAKSTPWGQQKASASEHCTNMGQEAPERLAERGARQGERAKALEQVRWATIGVERADLGDMLTASCLALFAFTADSLERHPSVAYPHRAGPLVDPSLSPAFAISLALACHSSSSPESARAVAYAPLTASVAQALSRQDHLTASRRLWVGIFQPFASLSTERFGVIPPGGVSAG